MPMAKPEMEFTDTASAFPWQPVPGAPAGLEEKILSCEPETGGYTRLVRFPPGFRGTEVLTHDFWEEVLILEGSFHDVTLGRTFMPGGYACRPPGMRHGPYKCPDGCLAFEIRYHKK
jgi:hypothetical protein